MLITILKILILFPITVILSTGAMFAIPIDKSGKTFRWFPLVWSQIIFWIFRIRISVKGAEKLEPNKPYIFVSNHASMFDIPSVMVSLNGNVNIIFKKELTVVPIWGWALRFGPFIMIDRSNPRDALKSIERAAHSIRNGNSVILFAEGTRTRDGKLQPFKRGAFSLALKAGVPVVPITINNTFTIMPKGSLNIKPANISVIIESPIQTIGLDGKDGEMVLMSQVRNAIEKNYINQ